MAEGGMICADDIIECATTKQKGTLEDFLQSDDVGRDHGIDHRAYVGISDIQMSFASMVEFMIKWAIAAIPAAIILCILFWMVLLLFFGGVASLIR
jgi:hypothetical protein